MSSLDRYKRHQKPKKPANLDGFISGDSFKRSTGNLGFQPVNSTHGEQTQKLDDFSRPDGYHPSVPTVTGTEAQAPMLPNGPRMRHTAGTLEGVLDNTGPRTKRAKKKRKLFRRPKSWPKFFRNIALAAVALFVIVGGYLGYKLYATQKSVFKGGGQSAAICDGDVPVDKLNKEGDGRVNILVLGIGGPGHDGPDLTDTIMLASVDTINDKVDLISIPRDLWVQTNGYSAAKINSIYPNAKYASKSKNETGKIRDALSPLDKKITEVTGVSINYHVIVNFKAFKDAVNAVGGVSFNVPEELYDPTIAWENKYNPVIAQKGYQHFNGARALLYAKSRETSSDFARGERQRLLIVALKDRVLSLGTFSNPIKISNLLDSFGNNVYTDFDLTSVKCLYKQGSQIPSSNIKSLDLVTPPHALLTTGPNGGQSTVFPRAGLFVYSDIQNYVRSTLVDGFIAKEHANIIVLNGTNMGGLAAKQADILKSYGYNVTKVDDAPSKNYQNTVIVDLRNGTNKYTRHYLESRYGVKAVKKLPDSSINAGTADFVIIIGANAANSF